MPTGKKVNCVSFTVDQRRNTDSSLNWGTSERIQARDNIGLDEVRGAANGLCPLDANGKVPAANITFPSTPNGFSKIRYGEGTHDVIDAQMSESELRVAPGDGLRATDTSTVSKPRQLTIEHSMRNDATIAPYMQNDALLVSDIKNHCINHVLINDTTVPNPISVIHISLPDIDTTSDEYEFSVVFDSEVDWSQPPHGFNTVRLGVWGVSPEVVDDPPDINYQPGTGTHTVMVMNMTDRYQVKVHGGCWTLSHYIIPAPIQPQQQQQPPTQ